MTTGNNDRTAKAFDLFDQALDISSADRAEWVRAAAAGDTALADEVLALLSAHDTQGLLDQPLPTGLTSADSGGLESTTASLNVLDIRIESALGDQYDQFERLGHGGMGAVFKARERKHDRTVVIKVLRPDVAVRQGEERFLQEVQFASGLTHPHILAFLNSGKADGLLYYVMPFIDGETLYDRVRREGPLAPEVAIPLLRDVADALAYAHERGVIHRDLKPANVLCAGDHAYLMDFGIAKALDRDDTDSELTRPGFSPGTPRYMAPEQILDGKRAGAPSDVYAWGQLAHEVLTGMLVPNSSSDPNAIAQRLERNVTDLPVTLGPLISQALSVDAAARPSAQELVNAFRVVSRHGEARNRRGWIMGSVAAAAVALAFWVARPDSGASVVSPEDGLFSRPIAVAEFRNETGDADLDFLGRMAGDWITSGLTTLDGVRVVPWTLAQDVVTRAKVDTAIDPVPVLQAETDAGTVVTGRYYRVGDQISFQADITDAAGRDVVAATDPVSAPAAEAERALGELRERILGAVSAIQGESLPGSTLAGQAPRLDAYRAYDEGNRLHRVQDYSRALNAFLLAHERDTTLLSALLAGVASANNVGDDQTSDSLMSYLGERRGQLTRLDDLQWQYLDASERDDGQTALRVLRETVAEAPGERGSYSLARVANSLNRPQEALWALDLLDPDVGRAKGWAQFWTQKAHALHLLERYDEEVVVVEEMVRRHPERTVTTALLARALASSGHIEALDQVLERSAVRPPRTYWSHGGALLAAGQALMAHGSAEVAQQYLSDAETWLEVQLETDPDYVAHLEWLGDVYYSQGRWAASAAMLERLMVEQPGRSAHRGKAAVMAARMGDEARARALLAEAGWTGAESSRLLYSARVAAFNGDFDRALADLSSGLERGISPFGWVHASGHHEFALMKLDPRIDRLLQPIAGP